jgi:SAM-dependent methyltransferase
VSLGEAPQYVQGRVGEGTHLGAINSLVDRVQPAAARTAAPARVDGMSDPIVETQRTYDLIAPEYARRNSSVDQRLVEDLDSMTAALPAGSLVADIGCGPGREIALLRARGFRVVGVDRSHGQLRTAALPGVAQADMRHLPLRTASVDAVWCQAALLHIPREDVPAVLAEFARLVRAGGELFLAMAEGDGQDWEVASNYASTQRRWFTYHRAPELTALLLAAGFKVRHLRRSRSAREWFSLNAQRLA